MWSRGLRMVSDRSESGVAVGLPSPGIFPGGVYANRLVRRQLVPWLEYKLENGVAVRDRLTGGGFFVFCYQY